MNFIDFCVSQGYKAYRNDELKRNGQQNCK